MEVFIIWSFFIICYALIFGFACKAILSGKGYGDEYYPNHGFAWGFWLGWIGLIVCVCKPDVRKEVNAKYESEEQKVEKHNTVSQSLEAEGFWRCPECGELYSKYATKCKCGYEKVKRGIESNELKGSSLSGEEAMEKINSLKQMLDNNLISQEEFDKKKKDILEKL